MCLIRNDGQKGDDHFWLDSKHSVVDDLEGSPKMFV